MAVPPPSPSPRPPKPLDAEPGTDPGSPVTNGVFKKALRTNELLTLAGILVAMAAALGGGLFAVKNVAAEAGAKPAKDAIDTAQKVKDDQAALRLEVKRAQEQTDASIAVWRGEVQSISMEQKEVREDIRALYRFNKTGSSQPRLEKPPIPRDGGP